MQHEALNIKALFSDQTPEFLKVQTIKPLRRNGRKTYAIRIRLRTAAGDADKCVLLTDSGEIPMRVEKENAHFIYFSAEVMSDGTPVRYAFRIRLAATGEEFLYKRTGIEWGDEKDAESARAKEHGEGAEPGESREGKSGTEGWWYYAPEFRIPDWANGAVMYQIFTDRFCNGDPDNDVLTGEYAYNGGQVLQIEDWYCPPAADDTREHYGGDLQGIMDKLDYLEELGIEVIYLNPIFVSPSNHKYDTQDYDHIDPHFGKIVHDRGKILPRGSLDNREAEKYKARVTDPANLEASDRLFANLVREAHMRGIRVILDGVFNHCGSFHRWLDAEKIYEQLPGSKKGSFASKKSPYVNYFRFEKDKWPSNDSFESWWGFFTLPKLSYETSEELCEYILEIGRKWVSPPYNADGWRLDVAADVGHSSEFNHRFWKRFRKAVKEANPEAVIIAENYVDSYKWLQGDEWDTIMNYEFFMEPLTYFLTGMEKHSDSLDEERFGDPGSFWHDVLCYSQKAMPDVSLRIGMNELSNHDHSRFLTRTSRIVGRAENLSTEAALEGVNMQTMRQAVLIQMTWTGSPTIYYGDEAGLGGFTDPDNRRTYPWGHEDHALILYHKVLTGLRHTSRALRRGSLLRLPDTDGVLAYARFTRGKSADKKDAENGTAAATAGSGRETFIVLVNINHIPIDYSADITCAGAPPRVEFECLLRTDRSGFAADPALIPAGARQQEDTLSDRLLLPVYTSDGILRMTLPPESGILLRWKAEK